MLNSDIKYDDRARQVIDFKDMHFRPNGKEIHPTDIDGIFEIDDRVRIIYETKLKGVDTNVGQRLLMERLVSDFAQLGKNAIAIYSYHDVFDTSRFINLGDTEVFKIYSSNELRWREPKKRMTVREMTDQYLAYCGYRVR